MVKYIKFIQIEIQLYKDYCSCTNVDFYRLHKYNQKVNSPKMYFFKIPVFSFGFTERGFLTSYIHTYMKYKYLGITNHGQR